MQKNIKLTMKDARSLTNQVFPGIKLERDKTVPDVAIFRGHTGADGMEIKVENDWLDHDGKIRMTLSDPSGMGSIVRLYSPETLERDYAAEEIARYKKHVQERIEWVHSIGTETAHTLVDKYWREEL